MEAREHAIHASTLLELVDKLQDDLDGMSEDERLQIVVQPGGFKTINESIRFAVDLAQAHALAGLALQWTESQVDELLEPKS